MIDNNDKFNMNERLRQLLWWWWWWQIVYKETDDKFLAIKKLTLYIKISYYVFVLILYLFCSIGGDHQTYLLWKKM